MNPALIRPVAAVLLVLWVAVPSPARQDAPAPVEEAAEPTAPGDGEAAPASGSEGDESWPEYIRRLYQEAKEEGQDVPSNVYEWAREDLRAYGDWEYKVVTILHRSDEKLEQALNELGRERWECFWIVPGQRASVYYMKRPRKSYIRNAPLGDLLKMIPGSSGEGDGAP